MRQFFLIYAFLILLVVVVFGLRGCKTENTPLEVFPDMDRQNKFHEQGKTVFFEDGRMDRRPVAGTVPAVNYKQSEYGHLQPDNRFRENTYLATGRPEGAEAFGDGIPVEVSFAHMEEGRDLYNIYCAICHGESGNGNGVIAQPRYGYPTIVSLLQSRIMEQPDGEIFNTITHGKNTMGPYGAKIRVEDRWKVVMYVRALQRAGAGAVEDVPEANRGDLGL
ncbi:MAG: cytochrome c [Verrucomicrobia bacterium]|jgi:mono/diheme cytochrome c family protein|nr:cytochrome c [Verrucomicrobiota bacterium]